MSSSIVSVSRGADLVRRDRQTLYNKRKQGKLTFVRRDDDSFGVDTAELQRVFGKLYVTADEIDENERLAVTSANSAAENELRHQLELREMELQHAKEAAERLRDDVRNWKEQAAEAASSVKLLEHQQADLSDQADKVEARLEKQVADRDDKLEQVDARWKREIAERQDEIRQARAEADEIRQRERDQGEVLRAERARVVSLQARGLWARLRNQRPAETNS